MESWQYNIERVLSFNQKAVAICSYDPFCISTFGRGVLMFLHDLGFRHPATDSVCECSAVVP